MDKQGKYHATDKPRSIKMRTILLSAFSLLIVAVSVLMLFTFLTKGQRIDRGAYQVVYMSTGQAYFGKLRNASGEYLVLEQPYTAQDLQSEQSQPAAAQTQTSLLKVSQQAYGPEDVMSLKADQVLFWQNLRGDSKVSQAIEKAN